MAADEPEPEVFSYADVQRAALAFALEDEVWPVFLLWMIQCHGSQAAHDWLMPRPDLGGLRRQFLAHSPDPLLRPAVPDWSPPDGD